MEGGKKAKAETFCVAEQPYKNKKGRAFKGGGGDKRKKRTASLAE
jgi:hypothetical protein